LKVTRRRYGDGSTRGHRSELLPGDLVRVGDDGEVELLEVPGDLGLVIVNVLAAGGEPRGKKWDLAGVQRRQRYPGSGVGHHCVRTLDRRRKFLRGQARTSVDAES
jgi:hypothetical protein